MECVLECGIVYAPSNRDGQAVKNNGPDVSRMMSVCVCVWKSTLPADNLISKMSYSESILQQIESSYSNTYFM